MKKLVAAENATLDGMVAEPDGGMNFMKYLDEDMARWVATHQNQWGTLHMARGDNSDIGGGVYVFIERSGIGTETGTQLVP